MDKTKRNLIKFHDNSREMNLTSHQNQAKNTFSHRSIKKFPMLKLLRKFPHLKIAITFCSKNKIT